MPTTWMHAHTHAHAQTRTRTHAKQNRLKQNSGSNLISPRMKLEYYRLSPDGSCQISVFAFRRPTVRESFHGCVRSLSSPFRRPAVRESFHGCIRRNGTRETINPSTAKACKISELKSAHTFCMWPCMRCMVVWCTQNAPRWQQFLVAPAMPAL